MADIHTPADIRRILSEGGDHPPGAFSPFGSQQIRLLANTAGLKACLTGGRCGHHNTSAHGKHRRSHCQLIRPTRGR
eukprot:2625005-Pyramimonas_sp.AAC.1